MKTVIKIKNGKIIASNSGDIGEVIYNEEFYNYYESYESEFVADLLVIEEPECVITRFKDGPVNIYLDGYGLIIHEFSKIYNDIEDITETSFLNALKEKI